MGYGKTENGPRPEGDLLPTLRRIHKFKPGRGISDLDTGGVDEIFTLRSPIAERNKNRENKKHHKGSRIFVLIQFSDRFLRKRTVGVPEPVRDRDEKVNFS